MRIIKKGQAFIANKPCDVFYILKDDCLVCKVYDFGGKVSYDTVWILNNEEMMEIIRLVNKEVLYENNEVEY